MGDTLRYAQRMRLIAMQPRGDLSPTSYALANPGEEYLVLQPAELADPFTVTMDPGTYAVHWYNVTSRETAAAGEVKADGPAVISFSAPFAAAGPAVLSLAKAGLLVDHET